MKYFATMNYKTANHHHINACSVGTVMVHGGKMVDNIYRLIKQYPNFHSDWTTEYFGNQY